VPPCAARGLVYVPGMQLAQVVACSAAVAATSARNGKTETIAALLRAAPPAERPLAALFLAGQLRQGKLGVGPALVHRALAPQPAAAPSLAIADVDATLGALAGIRGAGAGARREASLAELFARATAPEQQFLAGLLLGELRQGALESLVVDAIALATALPPAAVRRAQMLAADLAAVVTAAFADGARGIARFDLEVLRPVQPMLASPAADVADALAQLGRAVLEWKLDGMRVQVHRRADEVRVFSRVGNDVTASLPDLVALARTLPAQAFVLDGEVLALAPDGRPLRFQDTMRAVGDPARSGGLSPFFFDCLHRDGTNLLDAGTEQRFAELRALVPAATLVPRLVTDQLPEAAAFYADALARGHEGVVAKDPDAPYAAGRRGASWLKLKSAHTLDLVVLAAEWGNGRRRGLLSNLHLGARDPATGGFVMLGKTFKGLTDEMLRWQTDALLARETHRDGPTVFVRPELVVEIACNDVQTSPHYPGGMALRFARVKRYRDDKTAADADTVDTVRALHARGTDAPDPGATDASG
jgi:DNA ligase-1